MLLQTRVEIPKATFEIRPADRLLFVGSCFADSIGSRLVADRFRATVNPYGVMYNPASILHTVERAAADGTLTDGVDVAIFTLGTNHVYILNETGEIVDNCQKRPQRLFTEQELTIGECATYIHNAIETLRGVNPDVKTILTVSPIRYAKYGFHESQLSKATLLLACDHLSCSCRGEKPAASYFPAYEIINDELRDYRFYQPDMLHPTPQAADYIYERFQETYFSEESRRFIAEWRPIQRALAHRPFNPDGAEYKAFIAKAKADEQLFNAKWGL